MYTVIGNRVLIEPNDAGMKMSAGGLYIPEKSQRKPQIGTIVGIGPGLKENSGEYAPIDELSIGDKVLFNKFSAVEVEEDGKTYVLLDAEDVLGIYDLKE